MRLIAACIVLCGSASLALADDYCRQRTVYQSYQTYAAPIYSTPAYQYTPAYNYQTVVLVPKAVAVDVQSTYPDHYYSIDPSVGAERIMRATAEILAKQRDADRQDPQQPAPPPPSPAVPAPARSAAPPRAAQPVSPSAPRPSAYQDPELIGLLQSRCVKCHQQQNKMALLTPDGKLMDLSRDQALTTFWLVTTNVMPKTAPPVEDKYMPLFSQWIAASK